MSRSVSARLTIETVAPSSGSCVSLSSTVTTVRAGRDLPPEAPKNPLDPGWWNGLPFREVFDYTYDGVMRSYDDSQQRLGIARIDLLYVHDIGRVTHAEGLHGFLQLVQGEVIHAVNVPGAQGEDQTQLPNGKNYGFRLNQQYILANKAWAEKNPAAAKLFAVMQLSVADINAQNYMMSQGQGKAADIERHTTGWIKAHQKQFDGWLQQARAVAH